MTKISADDPIAQSANPIVAKVDQLRQLFPNAVTEAGQIDFEVLKELLSEYAEADQDEYGLKERYQFTWAGKSMARREASKTSTATLRPDTKESKDWDKTQNIFIEGDNLEVLKLLQKSYNDKVKLIYIDPPYNTGNDFVYPDDYKDNLKNYLAMTGQLGADGKKFNSNTEAGGRYHSNWLNMMYPRLVLARELLTEDGVMFISIDDNEVHNLRKICDEVFGTENFGCQFVWQTRSGSMDSSNMISEDHEYILCYFKSNGNLNGIARTFEKYTNPDNDPRGPWISDNLSAGKAGGDTLYPIIDPKTKAEYMPPKGRFWPYSPETMALKITEGRILFPNKVGGVPMLKRFKNEAKFNMLPISTLLSNTIQKNNNALLSAFSTQGTKELIHLLNEKVFSYPKPVRLVHSLFSIACGKNDLILDFFAGSGTTAHAVMQLNAEDGGNRKFICVQLPEHTPEDSEARKAGYQTISAITRERIRRAGDKIVTDRKANADKAGGLFTDGQNQDLDTGFRAYKLDSTNVIPWDSDPAKFSADMLFNDVIKQDRSDEDLMVELSLKLGLQLITQTETRKVGTVAVHCINNGLVFFALSGKSSPGLAEEVSKTIASWWADLKPLNSTVVLRDSLFETDQEKLNALLTITAESNELNPIKVLTI